MTEISEIQLDSMTPIKTGKVRSIYDLGNTFLFVASDRVSAYDFILPTPIPQKGRILTDISKFWFNYFKNEVSHHYIEDQELSEISVLTENDREKLKGRSMIVKKASVIPIECVVRGYISGSAWKEYKTQGTVNNTQVASGLRESEKFSTPIFTPATKAENGHDENIPFEKMIELVGEELSIKLRDLSIDIFNRAHDLMSSKGIILADTKFEFGLIEDKIVLIDEVLTPDSSRFWPKDKYEVGRGQDSYDKQIVRDYLINIGWDKNPPVPQLPEEIIQKTTQKYLEIEEIILK